MNDEIYQRYTEKSNRRVIENLKFLINEGLSDRILVRVPLIPGYNNETDIAKSIQSLNSLGLYNIEQLTYVTKSDHKTSGDYKNNESGKDVCRHLKNIRMEVASTHNISYTPAVCTHKGPCLGTCPACEKEVEYIESRIHEYKY